MTLKAPSAASYHESDFASEPMQLPDLTLAVAPQLSKQYVLPGTAVLVQIEVRNVGNYPVFSCNSGIYLSTDSVIDASDLMVTTAQSRSLQGFTLFTDSPPFYVPSNLAPGTYYIGAIADWSNSIVESDETNNVSLTSELVVISSPFTETADIVTLVYPDLGLWSALGGDDYVNGTNGPDEIDGGAGNDTIFGGGGPDPLFGGLGDDIMDGGDGNDFLVGGEGNDTLIGGAGLNLLQGDIGDDTYVIDNEGSRIIGLDDGIDTVATSLATFDLATTGSENLVYTGVGDFLGFGNLNNNRIVSGGGDDTLDGGGGDDTLDGGYGTDAASYAGTQEDLWVDLTVGNATGADAGVDTLISIESIYGGRGQDVLLGSASANTLAGGSGDDTLDGGAGGDTLDGGTGNDTVTYASATGLVVVYLGAPSLNFGDAAGDSYTSIEVLTGSNFNDFLYSSEAGEVVNGGAGIDQIYGFGGNDTLNGGGDFDYILGGEGNDTINGDASTDILVGENGNDTINGGDDFDQIYGGAGTDTLNGDGGSDYVFGGTENDTINGGAGSDFLYGEAGNDVINGGSEYDLLQGNDGDDRLFGGDDAGVVNGLFGQNGNDTLVGGTGIDYMWGGDGAIDTGNDTFEIRAGGSVDVILDFQAGAGIGDVLNLIGTGNTSFAQMQAAGQFVQVGSYAGVVISAGNVVYLQNVNIATLVADDFTFA
jgi:Ca2+-binding RTX toxin-like protein